MPTFRKMKKPIFGPTLFNNLYLSMFPMKRPIIYLLCFIFTQSIHGQTNIQQIGHLPYSQDLSDIWGYVDQQGNEYALVGVYNGFSVVSLADPANPEEVFFGPGSNSIWRDVKTWGDYAYVSNESGNGVYIVDLSPLPDGPITNTVNYTGSTYPFSTAHNLYIDEFGKLYIFGANSGNGGAIILDLTADPMNPVELGRFNTYYLHDGMARGDTLWGSAIYQGVLAAIDVSDPANPSITGTVSTPSQFTHNAWVSDDGTHVFTTDEVNGGYIGSFNVENLSNMFEADRVRTDLGNNIIPHNVHVHNDFLVTSYYTIGLTVHDARFPDKLFEVAHFDTSPNYNGGTFNGCWGAYPYLPSGLVLATDIEEGLYILEVDYIRAAYLEGKVRSAETNNPVFNVQVEIPELGISTQTTFDGSYQFGTLLSGTYDVHFTALGYHPLNLPDVELINGELTMLDVELEVFYVGLQDASRSEAVLQLYPNPFKESLQIELASSPESGEAYSILIHDAVGHEWQRIEAESMQNSRIYIGDKLPPGMYVISIKSGNAIIARQKVLKY